MGRVKRSLGIGAAVIVIFVGGVVALADTGSGRQTPIKNVNVRPITANVNTSMVGLSAPASELINASTGQVLYANQVLAKHYPASLVKLMTSLIAFEAVKKGQLTLNSIIPVSQDAFRVAQTPGLSVAYINPSERIPLWKMFEYMYVVSADDAAVAVGDDLGGSETNFARMMNAKARQLGMTDTRYTNASGLQDPQQYTTAHDVALLAKHLVAKYPIVLKYAALKGMYIHPGQYGNTYDQLLGQYPGLDGLKTGSTDQAGFNFVGTAKRGNLRLISVVLGTQSFTNVFQDTAALLDLGFSKFHATRLQTANQPLSMKVWVENGGEQQLAVAPKSDVSVQLVHGVRSVVQTSLSVNSAIAPVALGQKIGVENIIVNGQIVEQVPVYAVSADPQAGAITKAWRSVISTAQQGARQLMKWFGGKLGKLS